MEFKNSSNGSGISVISVECIVKNTGDICEHAEKFYNHVSGTPIIFWEFDGNYFPGCSFEQETSDSGDECHHNMNGLSNNQAGKIIKKLPIEDLRLCAESGIIPCNDEILSQITN